MDDLAALLLDGFQRDERAAGLHARFLLEFPLCSDEQILVGIRFALGNRPRPIVLLLEIGTAWMSQQDLKDSILDTYISNPALSLGMATFSTSDSQHLITASLELEIYGFYRPP